MSENENPVSNPEEWIVENEIEMEANEINLTEEAASESEPEEVISEEMIDDEPVVEVLDDEVLKRQQLIAELEALTERVREVTGYQAPPFTPDGLLQLIETNLGRLSPRASLEILDRMRTTISEDLLDVDTWKGIWYVLNYSLENQADFVKRRIRGEYETDEWGFDPEFLDAAAPFISFLYETYWRVETTGIENIPEDGRAMLVSNHSGQIPFDGVMIAAAVYKEHPSERLVRNLFANWFMMLPFVSTLLVKLGQVLANEDNGVRLLEQEQLVAVYPEGIKGVGKLFKDRYRLARFGRGGFVRMALKTESMMIPVSVVGAEETYVSLAKSPIIASLINFPFFPISLRWPWLGPLGVIPFPTKWYIDFGEPIRTDEYGADAANNMALVSQLTDQSRNVIQEMIYRRLSKRKSIFFG
jgi:1-acyl-sn-glycerol-3-phosphate acyltransferase